MGCNPSGNPLHDRYCMGLGANDFGIDFIKGSVLGVATWKRLEPSWALGLL